MAYQFAFIDESLRRHAVTKRFVEWLSRDGSDYTERLAKSISEIPQEFQSEAWALHTLEAFAFSQGEVYVISSEIIELIHAASLSLPKETAITEELVPSQFGVLICESPLMGMGLSEATKPTAIAWSCGPVIPEGSEDIRTAVLMNFREWDGSYYATVSDLGVWFVDNPLEKLEAQAGTSYPWRFMAALFLFMNDRILTTTVRPASRSMQRRIARAKNIDIDAAPTAKIIELRKREYVQGETREAADREYTCQWIVRGHWRNQWYASQGIHQPKWIVPHVKGPTDKPLKAPTQNVFAVVR